MKTGSKLPRFGTPNPSVVLAILRRIEEQKKEQKRVMALEMRKNVGGGRLVVGSEVKV